MTEGNRFEHLLPWDTKMLWQELDRWERMNADPGLDDCQQLEIACLIDGLFRGATREQAREHVGPGLPEPRPGAEKREWQIWLYATGRDECELGPADRKPDLAMRGGRTRAEVRKWLYESRGDIKVGSTVIEFAEGRDDS